MNNIFSRYNSLAIALISALLFIPFLGDVHLFDRDETGFAESAREMLVTKDYFRVYLNYQPFEGKPPLFSWMQALSMALFGVNEFGARFPNAVCGIVTLLAIFRIARKHFSSSLGIWWVLFMTASFVPHLFFKSGIIDPWFNLFLFLSIYQLYLSSGSEEHGYTSRRFILAGVFCGLAVLTKGPVALLIILFCVPGWMIANKVRHFMSFRQFLIAAIPFTLVCMVWIIAETGKKGTPGLGDFLLYQVKLLKGHASIQGIWYFPLLLLLGCFPASAFAIKGFFTRETRYSAAQHKWVSWMKVLFGVMLILFCITGSGIIHYTSLCYLPITFMAASVVDTQIKSLKRFHSGLIIFMLITGTVLSALLIALPLVESYKSSLYPYINNAFIITCLDTDSPWYGYEFTIGILFLLFVVLSAIMLMQNRGSTPVYALLGGFSALIPAYFYFVIPGIEAYTQKPAIDFYQQLRDRDAYVTSLGYDSYAQYFYTQSPRHENPEHANMNWLQSGNIDKPVYFVARVTDVESYAHLHLTEVYRKGGYILLLREPDTINE